MTPTCVLGEDKVTTTEFVRKIVFVVYVQRSETGKINLSERVCKLWPLHTQRSIITVVGLINGVVGVTTPDTFVSLTGKPYLLPKKVCFNSKVFFSVTTIF